MCVVIMFLINWKSSLITFFVILTLYLVVVYRKPGNINVAVDLTPIFLGAIKKNCDKSQKLLMS